MLWLLSTNGLDETLLHSFKKKKLVQYICDPTWIHPLDSSSLIPLLILKMNGYKMKLYVQIVICSLCFLFFSLQHVPPGGNTTFEVVFLARRVGNVENTLYIHTSVGTFKYQVSTIFFFCRISCIFSEYRTSPEIVTLNSWNRKSV